MYARRGFTLFELMISITIIGILASMAFTYGSDRYLVHVARSERLAYSIQDQIKGARDSMLIGRGVFTGGTYLPVTRRTIVINSGSIVTYYQVLNSTQSGVENRLAYPFYEGDRLYSLSGFSVTSSPTLANYTLTGMQDIIIDIAPKGVISFTGSSFTGASVSSVNARSIQLEAGYDKVYHIITLDRASGLTTLSKAKQR